MADSEESNVSDDMMDDDSKPDTESPSEGEGENTEFTSDESTVYGSKEKRRHKHNYDTYFDGRS